MLRLRSVLAEARVATIGQPQRLDSARNEVWAIDSYIVRLSSNVQSRRLSHEARVIRLLQPQVRYPGLVSHGRAAFGDWSIVRRVRAVTLAHAWPSLSLAQRQVAIGELGRAMKSIHQVEAAHLDVPFLSIDSLECPHQLPASRLMRLRPRLDALTNVDSGIRRAIDELIVTADDVLGPMPTTLIHGDLHLENVLSSAEPMAGVIDFEFARAGYREIDLEVLLRFCDDPGAHLGNDDVGSVTRDDFRPVVGWLHDSYPELFAAPNLVERVNLASLSYDARDLLMFPPDRPARDLPRFHPINRITRLLDGRGVLQVESW
jgi:aminoglycoside phosphotransferase (APT) family kinase protein